MIIFAESLFPEHDASFFLGVTVVIFAVSAYAHHPVEDPIRKSGWLGGARRKKDRQPLKASYKLTALSLLAVVSLTTAASVLVRPAGQVDYVATPKITASGSAAASNTDASTAAGQLSLKIQSALTTPEWPTFDPGIENMADQRVPQWTENGCLDVSDENIDKCVYGAVDSQKIAVVAGDSIATSWLPAIIGALEPSGYRIQAITKQGCPIALTKVYPSQTSTVPYDACTDHQAWATQKINEISPELIILSDSALSLERLVSKASGTARRTNGPPPMEAP
ncbi:hypothetical protein CQ020_03615 [Arthrobacter sp. MYb23]|uniref:SGNH hydrolase domain-containing protein n=1 Tax=unclassified Arthrobacter TaxID=235627 RepID=UPI000CFB617F|nr:MULTISPECIES: SGNH hydrolase domain-containing protein [unclassified Arthrobacter]PRB44308.1 hypothetical protein CQ038_03470 [Arthrobacter sp. MYb51]PRB98560.1 hypothetical protein CQ020_03615 [Arthrobacter sp. MYb23]